MSIKKIGLLAVALLILIGVVISGYTVLGNLKVKIDPRAHAKTIFAEFRQRALEGQITELTKDEAALCDRWSNVEDLCIESMNSIVTDYANSVMPYQSTLDAILSYNLFPVNYQKVNEAADHIVRLENGRTGYALSQDETDEIEAILLLCRVQSDDKLYYSKACASLKGILIKADLESYVKSRLCINKTDDTILFLQKIYDMTDSATIGKLLSYTEQYKASQENTVKYKGNIEILSVRNLMAFPETVYTEHSKYQKTYDSTLITPLEFRGILTSLYEKDYILIDITSLTPDNLHAIDIPAGKKPFALIIDDLTYPKSAKSSGVCDALTLSDDGRLCTVTDAQISYDNETIPILESFLAEHPDFTFKGARGCISLTGYNGILGYDISKGDNEELVRNIVKKLHETGWTFACHTYGYADMKKASAEALNADEKAWSESVGYFVGGCKVYVWPYGSSVRSGAKHEYLRKEGYSIFLGQGINPYKAVEPDGESIFLDRRQLSGYALQNYKEEYSHLFISDDILDPIRNKKEQD